MSAWRRLTVGLLLLVLAVLVCAAGNPLSGTTLLALVLAFVALDMLAPVLMPPSKRRGTVEDAADLLAAERGAR